MNHLTHWSYQPVLVALLALTGCSPQSVEKQIVRAIETDSAISRGELELIDPAKTLKLENCKGKPLTIALLTVSVPEILNDSKPLDIQFFPTSNPVKIFQEIQRKGNPYTLFHADRITDLECAVKNGEAKGVFSILVPDLYQGKIHYHAKRQYGRFRIEEFSIPTLSLRWVRQSDGTWKVITTINDGPSSNDS